ncbi:MAG: hypothetical protein JNG88_10680, partial [Phycisphaerales bacterium]|nr:hypothetical protein [Phycisphaerales bacterium]
DRLGREYLLDAVGRLPEPSLAFGIDRARHNADDPDARRPELAGKPAQPKVFSSQIAFNVFSHNSAMGDDGYNLEESKMIHETHKIFGDKSIRVAPTCVRVPVMRAHTESAAIEFSGPIGESEVFDILSRAPGVEIVDDRAANRFPEPIAASGRDEVLVGRIRRDASVEGDRGIQLLCAGDQLLKGAALNAVQIAELLL